MKRNKILLISLLAIFCLSIGAVCATDIEYDVVLSENQYLIDDNISSSNQVELSDDDNLSNDDLNTLSEGYSESDFVYVYEVFNAAPAFKKYVETYGKLPDTVKVGNKSISTESYTHLMAKVIAKMWVPYPLIKVPLLIRNYTVDSHKIIKINAYLERNNYGFVVRTVYINPSFHNFKLPTVVNVLGTPYKVSYEVYSYGFACLLDYRIHNGKYPSQMLFTSKPFLNDGDYGSDVDSGDYDNYDYDDYSNYSDDSDNVKSGNLENTGNPLLLLLFTLTILPILRIKK